MQLAVNDLSFSYQAKTPILDGIHFTLEEGSILGLLGHNGSGKSTLLKILSRIEGPDAGTFQMDGEAVERIPFRSFYEKVGVLIENPGIYPHLTVSDNLKIFASYHGLSFAKVLELATLVSIINHLTTPCKRLSTGMKQRVGLAISLMGDPDLLLWDEPTNGLDPEGIIQVRKLILSLKSKGKSIIISSHHLAEMEKVCDEVLILRNGQQIFHEPTSFLTKYRDLEELYETISQQ